MWVDKLREMKDASNLTTREIALQSSIPEPTLEKLFAGVTKDPKLETMRQLVHFLGYTLDDLEDTPAKKSPSATEIEAIFPTQLTRIIEIYNKMNPAGQEKLCEYAEDLFGNSRYKKGAAVSEETLG